MLALRHLAAAATLLIAQFAPGRDASEASGPVIARQSDVLTVATTGTIDSLNPFLAQRVLPTEIHRLVYDFLTNYDAADYHPVPALATSWSASADKLVWTFTIRPGMTWSDGVKVTAADVAWTYNLIMTNADAATANGSFVANFKSVSAPNDSTLVIRLARPQATMLALDIPVVPRHVWRSHAAKIAEFGNDTSFPVVGNGPFILTDYKQGQYVELSANENYWRGPPRFSRLYFRQYKDADAAVQALRKGEVDFVSRLTAAQFDALQHDRHVVRNRSAGKSFYTLQINPGASATSGQRFGDGNPALRDIRVRQAIRYAIDPQTLVDKTLGGYGQVGEGYLPPIFAADHWNPAPGQGYRYDPVKAEQLLDAAGYRRGPDGTRRTPGGQPFSLRLNGLTQRAADALNAPSVAAWLKAIGTNVITSIVDEGRLADVEAVGNFDLMFDAWLTNPDPDYVLAIQTCAVRPVTPGAAFPGDAFVCDPVYDRLYAQQLVEYNPTVRSQVIQRMQQRMYADAYVNVLYYPNVLEAYRGDVIGSMLKQPQPNGMYSGQDGYWSWWSAAPVARPDEAASNPAIAVGVVAGAVFLVTFAVVAVRRRRTSAEDRE